MNAAYEKCNWKVKILTQTAVSNHEGSGEFFSDNDLANLEVGGTIFGKKNFYTCFISGQKNVYKLFLQKGQKYMGRRKKKTMEI